jgi:hypothetical protein
MARERVDSHLRAMTRPLPLRTRFLRAWLAVAVADGLFASMLNVAYGAPALRVWKRVASTLLGPVAMDGGAGTIAFGLLLHVLVALAWTTVFLVLLERYAGLRALVSTPGGVLVASAVYGPLVWCAMSLVVIPIVTARPPAAIGTRWWQQLVGHIPFVALPIVGMLSRGLAARVPRRAPVPGAG